jgi:hypothetical protein
MVRQGWAAFRIGGPGFRASFLRTVNRAFNSPAHVPPQHSIDGLPTWQFPSSIRQQISRKINSMVNWFKRKIIEWSVRKQKRELEAWLSSLKSANAHEIGMLVVMATSFRHSLERELGINLLTPLALGEDPFLAVRINRVIKSLRSKGNKSLAAGGLVWLHTVRCGQAPEMRQLGRDLWRELRRGFPHVAGTIKDLNDMKELHPSVEDANEIPTGLEPDRI